MGANATQPVATVESLQAELTAEREAHQLTKDTLDAEQQAHQGTKDALEAEQSAHQTTKADADAAALEATEFIDGQASTIAEQAAQIESLQTSPGAFPLIEVNDVKYEVQAPVFNYKGDHYTLADLLANKDLQRELVGKKVGFLVKKEA